MVCPHPPSDVVYLMSRRYRRWERQGFKTRREWAFAQRAKFAAKARERDAERRKAVRELAEKAKPILSDILDYVPSVGALGDVLAGLTEGVLDAVGIPEVTDKPSKAEPKPGETQSKIWGTVDREESSETETVVAPAEEEIEPAIEELSPEEAQEKEELLKKLEDLSKLFEEL